MKLPLIVIDPHEFGRVAVVGDIHGDYEALTATLGVVDLAVDLLVFLGDYADRGAQGVETISAVAELARKHTHNVVALMGNHEDYSASGKPRFSPCTVISEAEAKKGSWDAYFEAEFKPFIDSLHLAALIPGNALLVHGGVSSKITSLNSLRRPSARVREDVLWSDPFDGIGEQPNMRGAGMEFGTDVSEAVCRALGVKRIIRSHQPNLAPSKPHFSHDGRVVTVQCTSVYGGRPFVYFIYPNSNKNDSHQNV